MEVLNRRRPGIARLRAAALLLLVAALAPAGVGRAANLDEYKLKGAFLFNFAKFVEWPAQADAGGKLTVCVLGPSDVQSALRDVVAGKSAEGRELEVRKIGGLSEAAGCHMLFVAQSGGEAPDRIAEALRGASTLTIGETAGFASRGGMINFTTEDNKLRLEINEEAAKKAGLKISSKLLKLATLVGEGGSH